MEVFIVSPVPTLPLLALVLYQPDIGVMFSEKFRFDQGGTAQQARLSHHILTSSCRVAFLNSGVGNMILQPISLNLHVDAFIVPEVAKLQVSAEVSRQNRRTASQRAAVLYMLRHRQFQ